MNRSRTRASLLVVIFMLGFVALSAAMDAGAASTPASPGPTLELDPSQTHAPGTVMIKGDGFSPGAAISIGIYIALNDQSGDLRYEAASTFTGPNYGAEGSVDPGSSGPFVRGGGFDEPVSNVCGSTMLLHAYDQQTGAWSNWLTLQPSC